MISKNLRGHLMLFTACTMVGVVAGAAVARAQSDETTYQVKKVKIIYEKNLYKQKDLATAATVLGQKDIEAEDPSQGSIQGLLKMAPSVVAYSQGPGQSAPTLAIRGVKNDELAETLDGVPLSSFEGGTGDYLSNNVGSPLFLWQIDQTTIYPGIAAPEDQGFGTVGGTVAYTAVAPTDERYGELEGGFGSFDTQHIGFNLSSGKMYDSNDAPTAILKYDQEQTAGYVSNTNAQYHGLLLNVKKPFRGGLDKVGLLIIFNQGKGSIQTTPTPVALIQANKWTYNFPKSLGFYNQAGQFLNVILSDQSYINPYLNFDGSLFYQHTSDTIDSYANPSTTGGTFPYSVNVQAPVNFYGDIGPSTYHYSPGYFTYDPTAVFGSPAAGESSEYSTGWGNKIGITPKLNIDLPYNTIAIGALVAKESGSGAQYIYGSDLAEALFRKAPRRPAG